MQALGNIVQFLYTTFLLRDVFGKAAPGAILLACVVLGLTVSPDAKVVDALWDLAERVTSLPLILQVLLFGLSWTLGFALQQIGIRVKFRKRRDKVDISNQLLMTEPSHPDDSRFESIIDTTITPPPISAVLERQIVIKEASGNLSIALLIGPLLFWFLAKLGEWPGWPEVPVLVVWLGIVYILLDRHRHQAIVLERLRAKVIKDRPSMLDQWERLQRS